MEKISYQNGKIYKIWSTLTDDFYIGSTTQPLYKRLYQHKSHFNAKRHWNMNIYQSIRALGKEKFFIELVQDFPCDTKHELCKREGELIRELKPSLNIKIDCRTYKEYLEDTKDYQRQRHHEYRLNNRESLVAKQKQQYMKNRDIHIERCRKYRETHKE